MSLVEEFELHNRQKSWNAFFDQLLSPSQVRRKHECKDARHSKFRSRNRYLDVSPYDHSRVRLQRNSIDYINANFVQMPDANRAYILTQGPLKETCGHFWLMIWEQNSRAIVMLNRIIEKEQVKCHQYYPVGFDNEGDDEMVFNDVGLKVTYITERHTNYHFTTRVLQLTDLQSNESREILQFHYTAWPDFGVPESPTAFLEFLFAIRRENVLDDVDSPPVIHCSAGIGRSGTICLVDTCLKLAEKNGGSLNSVNVVDILLDMRQYRMGLIQTADQLRFSYLAIIEGAKFLFQENGNRMDNDDIKDVDEQDAMQSFDDVIDSFDDLSDCNAGYKSVKPVSQAQARLEGLFVQQDKTSSVLNDITTEPNKTIGASTLPSENGTRTERVQVSDGKSSEKGSEAAANVPVVVKDEPAKQQVAEKAVENPNKLSHTQKQSREDRKQQTMAHISRIKQRMHEVERERDRQLSFRPYAVTALSVAIAFVGYLAYRYFQ